MTYPLKAPLKPLLSVVEVFLKKNPNFGKLETYATIVLLIVKNTCKIKNGTINKRIEEQHCTQKIDNGAHPS